MRSIEQTLRSPGYRRPMTSSHFPRRNLPHIRREGATYAVTWVLADRRRPLEAAERDRVLDSLRHFAGQRYDLLAAVVMEDHVHALLTPFAPYPLSKIMHSWKSFTAHELVKTGRAAPVWLDEYHDTIIRNKVHLNAVIEYIKHNPTMRWPGIARYRWLLLPPASGRP